MKAMDAKTLGAMPVMPCHFLVQDRDGNYTLQADGGLTIRQQFAMECLQWEPDDREIVREMERDRVLNPHNDPHKPKIRSKHEIIAQLQMRRADALLDELAKETQE